MERLEHSIPNLFSDVSRLSFVPRDTASIDSTDDVTFMTSYPWENTIFCVILLIDTHTWLFIGLFANWLSIGYFSN